MKVGIRLVWKDPEQPGRPPHTTALVYVDARNDRQVMLAAKRLQDGYGADDYEITGV